MIRRSRPRMTIAQLKQHMDRRFDRLLRTKADRVDLVRCATKGQLCRFATKKDLGRFATKEDLKRFATKEDLKPFATNDDMRAGFANVNRQFESLNSKIDGILKAFSASEFAISRARDRPQPRS